MPEVSPESARSYATTAARTMDRLVEVEDIDLKTLSLSLTPVNSMTLISIAINLDRIATALESKE